MMVLITLIGKDQAKVGNRFYFMGPQTECKECKLKGVCFNLEPGRQYEVTSVRDTYHDCKMHDDGVRAVEIVKISTRATVSKKFAIEGGIITFEESDCGRMGCSNYSYCHPIGIKTGDKRTVDEVIGELDCPISDNLVLVKLS